VFFSFVFFFLLLVLRLLPQHLISSSYSLLHLCYAY
jgi:hypothetical protein